MLRIVCLLFIAVVAFADEPKEPNKVFNKKESKEVEKDAGYTVDETSRKNYIYPSNYGQAGIFRVRSAEGLPKGALTFGIGGEFYSIKDAPEMGFGSREAHTIAESLFVGYSPWENITFALQRRNSSTTFGNPQQLISSLGDLNFSTLYSIPVGAFVAVAPIVDLLVASNFNTLAPAGTTVSVGGGGAVTAGLYNSLGIPLWAHFNAIYHIPQVRTSGPGNVAPETFFNFSRFHTLTLALGAELSLGSFAPFIEYKHTAHTNSAISFGKSPATVSLGTRIMPLENKSLSILLGADIGVSRNQVPGIPFVPSYQVLAQLSYTVGVTSTERKHYHTTKDVEIVDRKFVLDKDIKFQTGSAELHPDSRSVLDQIAEVIKENHIAKLMIVGHTDSSHTESYNQKLSEDRAESVKRYLTGEGIDGNTLLTKGYGKSKPIASNSTEEGRSANRRVNFFILD